MNDVDPDIFARHLMRPPKWLVDVGVGLGSEAAAFKAHWPDLRVVGMEPIADMRPAEYPGELLPLGAWSTECRRPMAVAGKQSHSFGSDALFQMQRLDWVFREYHVRQALLWLDIEGAELEALRGATGCLQHCVAINCETRVTRLHPRSCCMSEVDAFLAAFGFYKACTYNVCDGDDPHEDAVYIRLP